MYVACDGFCLALERLNANVCLPPDNRRLDEWVSSSRLYAFSTARNGQPAATAERTLTRNMKRKHNEMNHVQKVQR